MIANHLAEKGWLPDLVIRAGIRRLLVQRLTHEQRGGQAERQKRRAQFVERCQTGPIAVHTDAANDQHYEVSPMLFHQVLGPHMKYSCGLYEEETTTLAEAEAAMLQLSTQRAEITDGMTILDLGCGWGSMTCWLAANYPNSRVVAVSNSQLQKAWIEQRAEQSGLSNIEVITQDVNALSFDANRFDRIVSIEMIEHTQNVAQLMGNMHQWLKPGGKVFVHIFTHHSQPYAFEARGPNDWMAQHFFTGGMMPSDDLLPELSGALNLEEQWTVGGQHYQRTAEDWLKNQDQNYESVMPALIDSYGPDQAGIWWHRWRLFFMACAELWGYKDGNEWHVMHYRFAKPGQAT